MRPHRPVFAARRAAAAARRPVLRAAALAAALAPRATACGSGENGAAGGPSAPAAACGTADGKIIIPYDLKDRLREHGIDPDKWRDGKGKDWDRERDTWLREGGARRAPSL
ncbi:hypothetical protein SCWH03_46650 [Streptomyces pacificus]|uniref:Lipoprotein n=1 Tax=Streptomyces pacificus TaxID=2705029 RepID=A0A6A0B137_9ACTN|nr:hypothetical protein [Streptomyces pacificus]GFH38423.1 hypothetical protein SCWH03_46650 [Streptomyces pacificus]